MHRPQVLLKYALWVVVAVIAASHSVGYAVTSSVMRHHYVMLNHVNLCSANMKGSMDIVRRGDGCMLAWYYISYV